MDRIRQFADHFVRRAAGFGLLVIAAVVVALHAHRATAMHAVAILLTLEAATLYFCACRAEHVQYRSRPIWLLSDDQNGSGERRVQRIIGEIMRETFLAYAKRLSGPALAAWLVDFGMHLSG